MDSIRTKMGDELPTAFSTNVIIQYRCDEIITDKKIQCVSQLEH